VGDVPKTVQIRDLDDDYSGWMGVARSIKVTSVKPGGSVPADQLSGVAPAHVFCAVALEGLQLGLAVQSLGENLSTR